MKPRKKCPRCGAPCPTGYHKYCSEECGRLKAPAVYRFVCPDGRSYVGSRIDCRQMMGIQPSNARLRAALDKYPSDTWAFEILEQWPPAGCPRLQLRAAEQRHMKRPRTLEVEYGFNIWPATRDWR
jgi:hypothetical protein